MGIELEDLLDKIAEELILNEDGIITPQIVKQNQKTIRNGQIKIGRTDSDRLILYQKDIEANQKDLLETITNDDTGETISKLQSYANQITNIASVKLEITGTQDLGYTIIIKEAGTTIADLSDIIFNQILENDNIVTTNPLNVSQFISLQQSSSIVNVEQANEFLDTNIYELLPTGDTRQSRITRFFQELNALLPTNEPEFDKDDVLGVDRDIDGNWVSASSYSQDNSISYAQDNPSQSNIDEEDAFIHRLKNTANSTNSTKTIEDIYNTIEPYLKDILEEPITAQDDRQEYRNQSSGYLKFRNANQGIIIRNTNQDFIEGLNPSNLTYLNTLNEDNSIAEDTGTGFTITMWVRFLDKVSEGTLFNFGNPIRGFNGDSYSNGYVDDDAFGFTLETFVLNKDDETGHSGINSTWGKLSSNITNYNSANAFDNSNTARFVRLMINDNGQLRDSTVGFDAGAGDYGQKLNTTIPFKPEITQEGSMYPIRLFGSTLIPEDFSEWYFICASFNPEVKEDNSHDPITTSNFGQEHTTFEGSEILERTPEYWLNHMSAEDTYVSNSLRGNKCKVEIISKTDLLRARGFKV